MKIVFFYFGLLLLSSCSSMESKDRKIDELNRRVMLLEQRIDSLLNKKSAAAFGSNNPADYNTITPNDPPITNRCQAITRKGTQCRRKAKQNGYCWQHS